MADLTIQRRSPLAHLTMGDANGGLADLGTVRLRESPYWTMLSLRVEPTTPPASQLEHVLGTKLPRSCGQVSHNGAHNVMWLGPDEWLVISRTEGDTLVSALTETDAPADARATVIDVSANRTVLELSGEAARSVLEKGCPLDLHPRSFTIGAAVGTTLARVPLLLWRTEPDTYRLMPRPSFADYVARWLLDAMEEFTSDVGGSVLG